MLLSVVIPAFNEERTILDVVRSALAVDLPDGLEREVIVVDDASTDRTSEILGQCIKDPRLRQLRHDRNRGKSAAVALGFRESRGDLVLIQDADLEYHPSHYPELLRPILNNQADVVYGSRFLGRIRNMRPMNRFANRVSNVTFNLLYGTKLTDINTCFKLFTRRAMAGLVITSHHFQLETEISAKIVRRGLRVVEVPVRYEARSIEEGKKINWSRALAMYWGIIRFRFA